MIALLAAWSLFLWMFVAADGMERKVRDQLPPHTWAQAAQYAADWRHGMRQSWVAMPGFLAVLLAAGWWQAGTAVRPLALEAVCVGVTSLVIAQWAAPATSGALAQAFAADHGREAPLGTASASWEAAGAGLLTVASWTALVVGLLHVPSRGAARSLAPALVLYAALACTRPWILVAGATRGWLSRAIGADAVALASMSLLVAAAWLVSRQRPFQEVK